MIIDFTVENFRSIKELKTLSMHVENPKLHLASHVSYPASDKIGVLRCAGIYGANASGKSNVLLAFKALQFIACESGDLKDGSLIPCYEPYRLSELTKNSPSKFEIEFFNDDNIRVLYSISFNQIEILEEILDFYPSRQKANIFRRIAGDTWETISFGGLYKGGARRIPFFKNNSYLSKAGESAGAAELIRSIYKYIRNRLVHLNVSDDVPLPPAIPEEIIPTVAKLLCHVDTGISAIESKTNEKPINFPFLENFPIEIKNMITERSKRRFYFSHKTESGTYESFREGVESEGTRKLFFMLPVLINAFKNGEVVIVDELDRSFHPHIAELLIRLFNDSEINIRNAQLIFSTHNIHLMSSDNLRRDQIWFAEKNDGKTNLYSLDEFDKTKVKSDSPFNTWYDEGRFGALPKIDYLAVSGLIKPQN